MVNFKLIIKGLSRLGIGGCLKTVVFNFTYFPIRTAVRFPVFLAGNVKVKNCNRDSIKFDKRGGKTRIALFGFVGYGVYIY